MIQKNLVYQKTAKGSEAIANRQLGLSPRLRPMLILIDGKRTVEELTKLSQMFGDPGQLLTQLLEQDLIKASSTGAKPVAESASTASAKAPAATATAVAAGAAPPVSLIEAQRFATRRLLAILGPAAEPLCVRIESARTTQDFQAALTRAEGMVRDTRGAGSAAEFAAAMQLHKPA